jgi:ribosome-associated heat shock protein Hsp15
LDKWLWAVRIYKTRSLAAEACRAGHVRVGGQVAKPAHDVKVGEIMVAQVGQIQRTFKVTGLLGQRGSAKVASENLEDLTPPEEYAKQREAAQQPLFCRPKGAGRPTKKERRVMKPFFEG